MGASGSKTGGMAATLADTARRAETLAQRWVPELTEEDHHWLTVAFYRAESLAHSALETAIEQLDEPYVAALREQLEDEARHVAVFEGWHAEPPEPIVPPKQRLRTEPVWFTTLLINEVAGYCQFEMLAAMVDDPNRAAEVRAVAADEVLHIERLVRWLEPYRGKPAWADVDRMVGTFTARLPGRMRQFLPRPELDALRTEMGALIADLLRAIVQPR